jgi:predicted DNA-binding protein with PD1-like motif
MQVRKNQIEKVFSARLDRNEDLFKSLEKIATDEGLSGGIFWVIGTLSAVKLAYYNGKTYDMIERTGDWELVSCIGNIAKKDSGELVIHAHAVVSNKEGTCVGGHVLEGCPVAYTCDVMVFGFSNSIKREFDSNTGLFLFK